MDVAKLKTLLEKLAEVQASFLNKKLNNNKEAVSFSGDFKAVQSLEPLQALECVKTFEKIQSDLLQITDLLAPSCWTFNSNSVQVSSPHKFVPPVLDALLYIFGLSNESFRKRHFKALIGHYFSCLKQAVDGITDVYQDVQVRTLLPVAKIVLLRQNSEELLNNLVNFLRYPIIHQEEIYQVLNKKLDLADYDLLSYCLVPLAEKNGHLGEYYVLKILIKTQDQEETLDFFYKIVVGSNEFIKELIKNSNTGQKEHFFYGTLYTLYEKYGLEKLLDFAPKCYLSGVTGYMVLDNLASQGFTSPRPTTILNLDGLKAILSKLAKCHACSIILEEELSKEAAKQVSLYDIYKPHLVETKFLKKPSTMTSIKKNIRSFEYLLNKFPGLVEELDKSPEELKEAIEDFFYSMLLIPKQSGIRSVVNHGDMYVSNTLIKYSPDHQTSTDAKLIDFQLVRYIPPAYELLFFLYLTSYKETRRNHRQHLLDWYYENLSKHLKDFSVDPDKVYSRADFQKNVREMTPIAISMAFSYGQIHMDSDFREEIMDNPEMFAYYMKNRTEMIDICLENEHYRDVMRGLVEDSVGVFKGGFKLDRVELGLDKDM